MTRIELSYQGPTAEKPPDLVRYVGFSAASQTHAVVITNPSPRIKQALANLGEKFAGHESLLHGGEWAVDADGETEIARVFDTLRNHGALFAGELAGWPPAAIFSLYREKGLLTGPFLEVYLRRDNQGWSIYQSDADGDSLTGAPGRPISYERFENVVREQFAFLFEEYGFTTIHVAERESDSHYEMGLEAATCRIYIVRGLYGASVGIAPRTAQFGPLINIYPHEQWWYPVEAAIDFVYHRKDGPLKWQQIRFIDDILTTVARELEPVAPQVFAAVADPVTRLQLEAYIKNGWL